MISAGFSIGIFIFLTFTYFGFKFFLVDRKGPPMQTGMIKTVLSLVYIIAIVGSQLSINITNSKEHCHGVPQIVSAMMYTIIPNFFMLGLVMIILKVFPGWKEPFSNTIGYLILSAMGIKETFIKILKSDGQNKLLKMVTDDPSIMINEMTPENFDLFIARMGGKQGGIGPIVDAEVVVEPSAPPMKGGRKYKQRGGGPSILSSDYKKHLPELYNFVVLKDRIAEWFWYVLTGYLVIQNSNSYIQSIKCKRSPEELEAKLANKLNNPEKKEKTQKWALGY